MTTIPAFERPTFRAPPRLALAAIVATTLCGGYLMSPYLALYRLSEALRAQDCATLRTAIDWNRVRASIQKELDETDVAHAATAPGTALPSAGATATAAGGDDLPEFGSSFATTAVGNALSTDLTPESVTAMMHDHPVTMVNNGGSLIGEVRQAVDWAFFSGPRTFDVWLSADQDPHEKPVRLKLAFTRQHGWRVIGVWLPEHMLEARDAAHST